MKAQITRLTYWKSDHDKETNQDALCDDAGRGLFAVADGVGTASFSDIWAQILAGHFVKKEPLLSDDPFEVEWWLRRVVPEYDKRTPRPEDLAYFAQEKARQGSQSTLVTLRVCQFVEGAAEATLLGFGDSCAFIHHIDTNEIVPFPIEECDDFNRPPICVPSRMREFDRDFHRCQVRAVILQPGDTIILATDAVSRWLWCEGAEQAGSRLMAFQQIVALSNEAWAEFVECRRSEHTMRDDDATALVIRLSNAADGVELGCTAHLSTDLVAEREQQLREAYQLGRTEQVAVLFGDGRTFGNILPVLPEVADRARQVATASKNVLNALRRAVRTGQNVRAEVEPIWNQYADLLSDEPSVEALRKSLADQDVVQHHNTDPKRAALTEFRRALAGDDDEHIVQAYNPLLDDEPKITASERKRLEQAQKRLAMLQELRTAIQAGDERQIVLAYDPILDNYNKITSEERELTRQAQLRYEMPALVRQALATDDDVQIAKAYRQELIPRWADFSGEERERIELARRRVSVLNHVGELLATDDDMQILECVPLQHDCPPGSLTDKDRERIRLAEERSQPLDFFCEALASDDDDKIIASYHPILDGYAGVTEVDRKRLELARHRQDALKRLFEALHSNDDDRINTSYDTVLDGYPRVTDADRNRIALAQKRIVAFGAFAEALADHADDMTLIRSADPILFDYPGLAAEQVDELRKAFLRVETLWAAMQAVAQDKPRALTKLTRRLGHHLPDEWLRVLTPDQQERLWAAWQDSYRPSLFARFWIWLTSLFERPSRH